MRWEHPRPARSAGKVDDQIADVSFYELHRTAVIALAIVGIIVVGYVGYTAFNDFNAGIASTTQTTGKVTAVAASSSVVSSSNQVVPPVTRVTLLVGTTSFDTVLSCSNAPYKVGQTVKVADQLLHNGQHQYVPDLACAGGVSPYKALFPATTSSTSTTSTTA